VSLRRVARHVELNLHGAPWPTDSVFDTGGTVCSWETRLGLEKTSGAPTARRSPVRSIAAGGGGDPLRRLIARSGKGVDGRMRDSRSAGEGG